MLYRLYDYDLWGNEVDGYEVNDVFRTGHTIDIGPDMADRTIAEAVKLILGIKADVADITLEGEEIIFVECKGEPLCELRREDLCTN